MVVIRHAIKADAARIANLHALSWQQHYREAFSSHFLDVEVFDERLKVWQKRFQNKNDHQHVLVAEENGHLLGFICSYFDEHPIYGTYLDNLHVSVQAKGRGIGTQLMAKLAEELISRKSNLGFYLWVLTTNTSAILFYEGLGGKPLETVEANDIGDSTFFKTRYVWNNMSDFLGLVALRI